MKRSKQIKTSYEVGNECIKLMQTLHDHGHWGNHGKYSSNWIAYVLILGISICAFLFLNIFN